MIHCNNMNAVNVDCIVPLAGYRTPIRISINRTDSLEAFRNAIRTELASSFGVDFSRKSVIVYGEDQRTPLDNRTGDEMLKVLQAGNTRILASIVETPL